MGRGGQGPLGPPPPGSAPAIICKKATKEFESVQFRTEPVFELTLAPSEEKLTNEFRSNSGIFYQVIVLRSQVAPLCQGKGQRSRRAKKRRKHFFWKIGRANSNLVAVLVSDLWAMAGKNGTVFENKWPSS